MATKNGKNGVVSPSRVVSQSLGLSEVLCSGGSNSNAVLLADPRGRWAKNWPGSVQAQSQAPNFGWVEVGWGWGGVGWVSGPVIR